MAIVAPDPRMPRRPLSLAKRITALARRSITALVPKHFGNRFTFFSELVNIARVAASRLGDAFASGQTAGWFAGAHRIASSIDEPPVGTRPIAFDSPLPPNVRFPITERATRHLANLIDFTPQEFEQLDEQSKRVGFAVARVATTDAVRKVRVALAEDIRDGGTLKQFREKVCETLESSGLSESQTEAIYRTQVGRAYSAGQQAVLDSPFVADAFPYLLYSATHDARTRPEHLMMESLGLDGTAVYRRDDPVWDLFYPPWAWNCRCAVIPLSVEDAASRGVKEAMQWMRTNRPPIVPQYVAPLPFNVPKGWTPTGQRLTAVY